MMQKYIVRPGGTVHPVTDLLEWAEWFEDSGQAPFEAGGRLVAQTPLIGESHVSTVFLALDHRLRSSAASEPVLFETMIFGGPHDQYQRRYTSLEAARNGHAAAVRLACGETSNSEPGGP